MPQINIQHIRTKMGELTAGSFENKLCMLDWKYRRMRTSIDNRIQNGLKSEFVEKNDDVIENTKHQLDEYFKGTRSKFDIPLLMVGTEFQKSVWDGLIKVPYGTTSTYLQLAKTIGNAQAVRAVATANGANAISIIVPCHRIIGSDGKLVGYAGGLLVKQRLLELEKSEDESEQFSLSL